MAFRKCLVYLFLTSVLVALGLFFLIDHYFSQNPNLHVIQLTAISLYMWIPGVFALLQMKKEKIAFKIWKKPSSYFLHALWIPVLMCFFGFCFNYFFAPFSLEALNAALANQTISLFKNSSFSVAFFLGYLFLISCLAAVTFNFIFALGEELFWRGYLWEKMKCLGFYKASFWIGVIWGIWHAPIILLFGHNYPEHRILGVFLMIVLCILLSPIYIYFRVRDKSLQAPTILHGMTNAFLPLSVAFFPLGDPLLLAPLGLGGFLALALINLYFFHPKRKEELQISRLPFYS